MTEGTNGVHLHTAITLANKYFEYKTDRTGKPMILHTLRVSARGKDLDEVIVGMLHDILEDTDCVPGIIKLYFPDHIYNAVVALTRIEEPEKETYKAFIQRIKGDALAVRVKLNDIADNLGRAHELGEPEQSGLRKRWLQARITLGDPLSEDESTWLRDYIYGAGIDKNS